MIRGSWDQRKLLQNSNSSDWLGAAEGQGRNPADMRWDWHAVTSYSSAAVRRCPFLFDPCCSIHRVRSGRGHDGHGP